MRPLHSVLLSYKAVLQSQQIVSLFSEKSTKSSMFHNTVFFTRPSDGVKSLMEAANEDLDDLFTVLLVSTFEHILFNHPNTTLSEDERERGLACAIIHFKNKVSPKLYKAATQLRRYRDWVAHGKRWQSDPNDPLSKPAGPEIVCSQLLEFLAQAGLESNTPSTAI